LNTESAFTLCFVDCAQLSHLLTLRFSKREAGLPRGAPNSFRGGSVNRSDEILYCSSSKKKIKENTLMVSYLVKETLSRYISFGDVVSAFLRRYETN